MQPRQSWCGQGRRTICWGFMVAAGVFSSHLRLAGDHIAASSVVRVLGVLLTSDMSMDKHAASFSASWGSCAVYVAYSTTTPSLRSSMPLLRVAWTTVVVYSSAHRRKRRTSYSGSSALQCVWCWTLVSMTEAWRTFGVTFCTGWMSLIASVLESASRCLSVSMGWHRTTCLLCATLHPDSLDARIFALRIADSSTFHALHCRRAVFEPSRMLVHLCRTLCPFISRTAIWLLQLSCAILSLISFLSADFVLSAFGVWSHKRAI